MLAGERGERTGMSRRALIARAFGVARRAWLAAGKRYG